MEKKVLRIEQSESKKVLALYGHLLNIFRTCSYGAGLFPPNLMQQHDVLLASGSLRALFFDKIPILSSFLKEHKIEIRIPSFESDLNFAFMPHTGGEFELSDFLLNYLVAGKQKGTESDFEELMFIMGNSRESKSLMSKIPNWAPNRGSAPYNHGVGVGNGHLPCQLIHIRHRSASLDEWGALRIGYLKNRSINRHHIIRYTANQLGGVHYDPRRLPRGDGSDHEYVELSSILDLDNQSFMHGALVATALCCIEIAMSPDIRALLDACELFLARRQERLQSS